MNKKIVMITGIQRSGTNILFESLKRTKNVRAFNEGNERMFIKTLMHNAYMDIRLKPESELRHMLTAGSGPVLLKPISEDKYRSYLDLFKEFSAYALRVVYIYRNPVNVYYSWTQTSWDFTFDGFMAEWHERIERLMNALQILRRRIVVVKYEDMVEDPTVFWRLCALLKMNGKYLFREDRRLGEVKLEPRTKAQIIESTYKEIQQLCAARRFVGKSNVLTRYIARRLAKRQALDFAINLDKPQ